MMTSYDLAVAEALFGLLGLAGGGTGNSGTSDPGYVQMEDGSSMDNEDGTPIAMENAA